MKFLPYGTWNMSALLNVPLLLGFEKQIVMFLAKRKTKGIMCEAIDNSLFTDGVADLKTDIYGLLI